MTAAAFPWRSDIGTARDAFVALRQADYGESPALFCFLRESCNGRHGKRLKLKVLWIQSANFNPLVVEPSTAHHQGPILCYCSGVVSASQFSRSRLQVLF
jgi:hypothetical protein